jgi:hypothetical protein
MICDECSMESKIAASLDLQGLRDHSQSFVIRLTQAPFFFLILWSQVRSLPGALLIDASIFPRPQSKNGDG